MSIKKNDKCVVYFHRNSITNQIFYVGIGELKRAYKLSKGSRNIFWWRYVNKYGLPIVEIVHKNISDAEAIRLEIYYITKFGRRDIDDNGILVNRSTGGEQSSKGFKHSEEARKKITAALNNRPPMSAETKMKISNSAKGKIISEAAKLKNSIAHKGERHFRFGKHLPDETKRKIGNANRGKPNAQSKKVINTITKTIYSSGFQVAKIFFKTKHPITLLSKLNGRRTNDTDFQYLEDYEAGKRKYVNPFDKNKPIKVKCNLTGKIYDSITEASRNSDLSFESIRNHVYNRIKKEPLFSLCH